MPFEVTAKSLGRHVRLPGHVFQRDRLVILLHDEIVDGADTNALMLAVYGGL